MGNNAQNIFMGSPKAWIWKWKCCQLAVEYTSYRVSIICLSKLKAYYFGYCLNLEELGGGCFGSNLMSEFVDTTCIFYGPVACLHTTVLSWL